MSRVRSFGILTGSLAVIVALTGCGNGKDMQINMLQDKLRDAEQRGYDLETQLAAAMSDADEARSWAAQLQQELANARQELTSVEKLPPDWQQEGGVAWKDLGVDILFDSGKAKLKATGRDQIAQVCREIQAAFPDRDIWVVGHTDSDPITVTKHLWIDNLDLSLNRARTVALELHALGLDPKHVIAGGQGEFNPIAPNDTKANRSQNRRVEIIAVQGRGGSASAAVSPTLADPVESSAPAEQIPPEK